MILNMNYWNKVLKKFSIILFTILGIYLGFKLAIFYMPFLIAFILALIIEPIIKFLMKKFKWRRKVSAIIIFIIALSIIIGLIAWGIVTLISEASNMLKNLNIIFETISVQFQKIINRLDFNKISVSDEIIKIAQNSINNLIGNVSVWAEMFLTKTLNTLTSLPTLGIYIVITLLALYFICTDKIYMIDQLEHHFPEKWIKTINKHFKKIIKTLGFYLKAEIILVIISFVISIIGLYTFKFIGLNVQYPLIMAIAIGFVDALPIFGSGTVMLPWAVLTACNGDFRLAMLILILWSIMTIIRQFIEPRVVSKQIGIHPIFTLVAMYTGFKLSGLMGLFIGPIILIILKNIFATTIDKGFIKSIIE